MRPSGAALHTAQQRGREKAFLAERGFPTVPFARATTLDGAPEAVARIGPPGVIKTAAFGYDGKGQHKITRASEAERVWNALGARRSWSRSSSRYRPRFPSSRRAVSTARSLSIPPFENRHSNHILDVTTAPADIPARDRGRAREIARAILEALDYVGVLCVEFFLTHRQRLAGERTRAAAPQLRTPHVRCGVTSQFEQQVRAICGLPLGSTELLKPAAMANLLGELWSEGEPNWAAACRFPDVKLHLYGKAQPRPGRKMGHLTATARTVQEAQDIVVAARDALLT